MAHEIDEVGEQKCGGAVPPSKSKSDYQGSAADFGRPDGVPGPLRIGLAMFLFFPLGFRLLGEHQTLRHDKWWRRIGITWAILGGWIVALDCCVLVLCLRYLDRKFPDLGLGRLIPADITRTIERVERGLAGPDGATKPRWVGLAIFLCFPIGLYLLWRHPTLGRDRRWWGIGGSWSLVVLLMMASGDHSKRTAGAGDTRRGAVAIGPVVGGVTAPKVPSPSVSQVSEQVRGATSGQWVYIDKAGNVILPGPFDRTGDFSEGLAGVEQGGKWGYINKAGTPIITPLFKGGKPFRGGVAQVWSDTKSTGEETVQTINKSGDVVLPGPDQLVPFKASGKYGCKNGRGEVVILAQFDFPPEFTDRLAIVHDNGQSGMIDESGHFLVRFSAGLMIWPNDLPRSIEAGLIPFTKPAEPLWGFLDRGGRIVIAPKFAGPSDFSEGLAAVSIGTSNREVEEFARTGVIASRPAGVGYIDQGGSFVIPPQFDEGRAFSEGLAAVKVADSGGKWGFIDKAGHIVIRPVFDDAPSGFRGGLARIEIGKLVGFIDRKGDVVIEPRYLDASDFSEGLAAVRLR